MKTATAIKMLLPAVIALIVLFTLSSCSSPDKQAQADTLSVQKTIKINTLGREVLVNAGIADTPEARQEGLMGRKNLDINSGMLFVFDTPGRYGFWMKNTLIPLDIIFIDDNMTIVDIKRNFQPCEDDECIAYKPDTMVLYVLEINAGLAEKASIKIGDKIII